MTKQTKDTIEGLKYLSKNIGGCCIIARDGSLKLPYIAADESPDIVKFLSHAIQIAQAQEQAEGMLPEKKIEYNPDYTPANGWAKVNAGFNQAISIATPILAKKILKIQELEKELQERCDYCPIISQEKELQSLKSKLTVENVKSILYRKMDNESRIEVDDTAQALIKELETK